MSFTTASADYYESKRDVDLQCWPTGRTAVNQLAA
jgi:hypothetical protein